MVTDTTDDWQRTWHHLQDALGHKWALHVLHVVADAPRPFGELRAEINGISETMLARRLADLREKGFIEETTSPETPPRKRYRLTPAGERVAAFLEEMESIAAIADSPDGEGERLVFET